MGVAEFLGKRAKLSAFVIAISAAVVSLCLRSPSLQNDDLQIYFMLLNGGEDVGLFGYGIFTNILLGKCVSVMSHILPEWNIYLIFLFSVSFCSCFCMNFYVLRKQFEKTEINDLFKSVYGVVSIVCLLLLNIICIGAQYTHVAIMASLSGLIVMSMMSYSRRWYLYGVGSFLLIVCSYCLRAYAIIPALFLVLPFLWRNFNQKRIIYTIFSAGLFCFLLGVCQEYVYSEDEGWDDARISMLIRQKILDTADNSGLDKSGMLEDRGINPDTYKLFRSFVYTPSMDSVDRVSQCLTIHQFGRKGFLGSSILADKGMLDVPMSARFNSGLTLFQRITPWVPLCIMVFLWCVGGDKRHTTRVMSLFVCLFAYVSVLLLLQRMVGRVLDPALYACAVWMMAQPIAANKWNVRKWVAVFSAVVGVLGCLFFVRHWRVSSRETVASEYCAARADTLFLTTCQQGLGLYPIGFCGYSYKWLSQTNILPIADGWNYYSPAYKAALAARGFSSLEEAFFHPHTLIIVREGSLSMTKVLERLADCEWNKKIECSVVDTYGGFHFVKVVVKD